MNETIIGQRRVELVDTPLLWRLMPPDTMCAPLVDRERGLVIFVVVDQWFRLRSWSGWMAPFDAHMIMVNAKRMPEFSQEGEEDLMAAWRDLRPFVMGTVPPTIMQDGGAALVRDGAS